ncbi:MAG TPA: UDP-glucose/GDP-mannose dehydrogenase family protein [Burkholderiales bacterium]|jgi:UDPglucose 6-dehydrogenase|nr:UDP-glucose/GDP-mannose dehydrogenase family protein [Burkholderiales bacterium]
MKVTIVGTGYVGLVSGACLAEIGHEVVCLDVDAAKIQLLKDGGVPIYEPGLEGLIRHNAAAGRLRFTTEVDEAVAHGLVQFIAVGTPPDEDGSADLRYVLSAARNIGRHMTEYRIIVDKSTVPVGTAERVRAVVDDELKARGKALTFSVVSNPEFLKEGAAVEDFMRPDRIIIGTSDEQAIRLMRQLYAPINRNHDRLMVMDTRSAELTKYAANAMLATRISFMNELANLAEKLGANIEAVRLGIGSDPRIGYHFLYAGCGYGGSCFPKDIQALQHTAGEYGMQLTIIDAVEKVNRTQKQRLLDKVRMRFGEHLDGRRFALWGLSFKPNTNDMREAPSRVIVNGLLTRGATVRAYDPVAMTEGRRIFQREAAVSFADSPLGALDGADALIIVTEWKEFRGVDFEDIKRRLSQPVVFDGRNLYDPLLAREAGIEYFSVGRP